MSLDHAVRGTGTQDLYNVPLSLLEAGISRDWIFCPAMPFTADPALN